MADDDFGFWIVTLVIAVVSGGGAALRAIRMARLIEDMPTSRIRSAAQGYIELDGRGLPLPGTQNLAPLTRRPCLWWRYRISKKVERGGSGDRRRTWQTVASGTSAVPFLLDDQTGQCIVKPDGAEIVATESTTWYGNTPWPAGEPSSRPWLGREREYRYVEDRIYEHERLYALGDFRSTSSGVERDLEAEQSALLTEWKQDQPALIERFDANRDGKVDLMEWEQARDEARRTVLERKVDRPLADTLHVLARPDGERLFLLAAMPPGNLARRYRRRATWSFVIFVGAVCALGWLLQDALG